MRVVIDEAQHRLRVDEAGAPVERMHVREHHRHRRLGALLQPVLALAPVVQVGQHHEVAHRGQAPRHVVQLLALARRVHVEQHHRVRPALFGVNDEGVHVAVVGADVEVLFDQRGLLGVGVLDATGTAPAAAWRCAPLQCSACLLSICTALVAHSPPRHRALLAALLTACASAPDSLKPARPPERIQADIEALMPDRVARREAWAVDLQLVFAALQIEPTRVNVCAVLAVTEQETGFQVDPPVPNLAKVAREEIMRRAERAGVPQLAVTLALQLRSPDGRSYDERLAAVRTEGQLSVIYEQFIAQVPLGAQLFADLNPVRTGGPMQVSIAFAEADVRARPYPFPAQDSVRHEVFTRRGGLYFGTAHLLDYAAPAYGDGAGQMIFRFADFNAGRLASRNAAFQRALAVASGHKLDLDGDLLAPGPDAGQTEAAARSLGPALAMSDAQIRRQLQQGDSVAFDDSALLRKVYALAEQRSGRAQPRALIPSIVLSSPKITRRLTTEWFARRVDERLQRCLRRDAG